MKYDISPFHYWHFMVLMSFIVLCVLPCITPASAHADTSQYAGDWVISGQSYSTEFTISSAGIIVDRGIRIYVPYDRDNGFGTRGSAVNEADILVNSSGFSFSISHHVGSSCGNQGSVSATFTDNNTVTGKASASQWCYDSYNKIGYSGSGSRSWQAKKKDVIPPIVTTFNIPPNSDSLIISINAFTATDENSGIESYMITETATVPLAASNDWTSSVPATYAFISQGSKTLYAWAKDASGNVSQGKGSPIVITLNDTSAPNITDFNIPGSAPSMTVPVTLFRATDNIAVSGYLVSENSTAPRANSSNWSVSAPTSYTYTSESEGLKTLYAWAKDEAGNVSTADTAVVIFDITAPVITTFNIPRLYSLLTIPIDVFSVTDNVGVTSYLITESSTPPAASASDWFMSSTPPVSFLLSGSGNTIIYAWAKDASGNVSAAKSATVTINTDKPTVSAFTVLADASSLTVPVSTFAAVDTVGVTGYMITENFLRPSKAAAGWAVTPPTTFTVSHGGRVTLYAWARNAVGNVSDSLFANVNITVPGQAWSVVPRIAAGGQHSVALRNDGTVWAWGDNSLGQLGDGTNIERHTPVQVSGLDGVIDVAAGSSFTVALKKDGTVWAWGSNYHGKLGDGSTDDQSTPVQVSDLNGIIAISAGKNFTMALKNDGTVWAWGSNGYWGQLGDGISSSSYYRSTPVQVSSLSGIIAISVGGVHTVALKNDGTVWDWGYQRPNLPTQVSGFNGVIAITASSNCIFALKNDGTVWAWSEINHGLFGDGTYNTLLSPVQAKDLGGVIAVETVYLRTFALKNDGTVWAWGDNFNNEFGDDRLPGIYRTPVQVNGLSGVISLAIAKGHALALKTDGTILAWGNNNSSGQLGDGTYGSTGLVRNLSDVTAIAAGDSHTATLKNDGTVWVWGRKSIIGEISDSSIYQYTPVQVKKLGDVTAISAGHDHTVALKDDGTVWAWGLNNYGQLGNGSTDLQSTPAQVSSLSDVVAIAAGSGHTVALKSDGTMWSWGHNDSGQLWNGTNVDRYLPVQISDISGVTAISVNDFNTFALKNDGSVWAGGSASNGQLGVPVQVTGLDSIIAISGQIALRSDGTVWTWGSNNHGQLGDGSYMDDKVQSTPVQVRGLVGVTAISAGGNHRLALKNDGTVWAWGYNNSDQLANGFSKFEKGYNIPYQVYGLTGVISAISAGGSHTVVLKDDGMVWSWGNNFEGQLGDVSGSSFPRPSAINVMPELVITSFIIPSSANSVTVPVETFISSDDTAIAAWCVTQSNSSSGCTWSSLKPSSYTFSGIAEGDTVTKILYGFAKDLSGNLLATVSATTTITKDTTAPIVEAFTLPVTAQSLTVDIAQFTATDNKGVTGYLVTESSVKPAANNGGWSDVPVLTYVFADMGEKTLYAWTKDAMGNVSLSQTATTTITLLDLAFSHEMDDFSTVGVGNVSAAHSYSISNSGKQSATLSGLTLSDPQNYSLDITGGTSPCNTIDRILDPGELCTFTIRFHPITIQSYPTSLSMTQLEWPGSSRTLPLTGSGIINDVSANFPYPTNAVYPFGIMPSKRSDADAGAAYLSWKEGYVTSEGAQGLRRVVGDRCSGCTVSEGIGYGMLLAVNYNDKALFDDLWGYYKQHLDGNGLMNWKIGSHGNVVGENAATDADEDVAFSLILADNQWGSVSSKYRLSAIYLVNRIMDYEVEAETNVLKPGDVWGGSDVANPSYFAPAYYRAFQVITGDARWNEVLNKSYDILAKAVDPDTGLVPDWCTADGAAVVGKIFNYGYDAVRTPLRIAMDYLWYGEPRAASFLQKITNFAQGIGIKNIKDGYSLDGTVLGSWHNSAFVGTFSTAVMSTDPSYQSFCDEVYGENVHVAGDSYYSWSLKTLSLFLQTGNMFYPEPPNISDIADQITDEDKTKEPVNFTVGDLGTSAAGLIIAAVSSNPVLVPNENIILAGSGVDRTVTVIPADNQSGTAVITVTVSDGSASSFDIFALTVAAVNDHPTIEDIGNQATSEDIAKGPINFTVDDVETSAADLIVTVVSSNTTLLPNENIILGGTGVTRNVLVQPAANQSGTAIITVTVSDGSASTFDTFSLSVDAVDDPISFLSIPGSTVDEDSPYSYSTTVLDVDASDVLTITGAYPSWLHLDDAGKGKAVLSGTPTNDNVGSHNITLTVSNDSGNIDTQEFTLTVININDRPTIQNQGVKTDEGISVPITLSASDADGDELIWKIDTNPSHGTLSGTAPSLVYTPKDRYYGDDFFTFIVGDSHTVSDTATVSITVANRVLPCDINDDNKVDMQDIILIQQICTDLTPDVPIFMAADVNDDGQLGFEEVMYILQVLSE